MNKTANNPVLKQNSTNKSFGKKIVTNAAFPVIVIFVVFLIINSSITASGLSQSFLTGFFTSNFASVCVAIATGIVIIGGGIDISLGAVVSLVNVCLAQMITAGMPIPAAVILAVLIGFGCGCLNGFLIGILRVSPMLGSFATLSVFSGLALWVMPLPGGAIPQEFRKALVGTVGGVPVALIFIVAILVVSLILFASPLGMKIRATGFNMPKAFQSGIKVERVQFFTYAFAGLICGVGTIVLTANMGSGDPNIGVTFSMNAIASCVIGGIALSGGLGNTVGAMFGALFLGIVTNLVAVANIPTFYQSLIYGVILLVGMIGAAVLVRRTSGVKQQ